MARIRNQTVNKAILSAYFAHRGDEPGEWIDSQDVREAIKAIAESELGQPITTDEIEKFFEFMDRSYSTNLERVVAFRRFFYGYLQNEVE